VPYPTSLGRTLLQRPQGVKIYKDKEDLVNKTRIYRLDNKEICSRIVKINNKVQKTLPHDPLCTIMNISVTRHLPSPL
jgi:hypothetical protein